MTNYTNSNPNFDSSSTRGGDPRRASRGRRQQQNERRGEYQPDQWKRNQTRWESEGTGRDFSDFNGDYSGGNDANGNWGERQAYRYGDDSSDFGGQTRDFGMNNFDDSSDFRTWEESSGRRGGYQEPRGDDLRSDFRVSQSGSRWGDSGFDPRTSDRVEGLPRYRSGGSFSDSNSGGSRSWGSGSRSFGRGLTGSDSRFMGSGSLSGQYRGTERGTGLPNSGNLGQGWDQQGRDTEFESWRRAGESDNGSNFTGRSNSQSQSGRFFGVGPKGYTRSDERIKEDINERLASDWQIDASDITVAVKSGEVTLTGNVDSRETKNQVEDVAECLMGVTEVNNQLRVKRNSSGQQRDSEQSRERSKEQNQDTTQRDSSGKAKSTGSNAQH